MSTINWNAVFIIAALAAVYGFGRDVLRSILDRRKALVKSEQDAIMAPLATHGIILQDTEKAIALQSALMVQGRADLAVEQKRRIEAEAERDALQRRLEVANERERELLIQLGRSYGQRGGSGADGGV